MTTLPDEVTFANARAALGQALAGLESAQPRFDLSACRRFDSSLVGVLLELARQARARGRACAFAGAPDNLRKLAGLYGVERLLFGTAPGSGTAAGEPHA